MFRPTFSLVAVNQVDVQMTSKTVSAGHPSFMSMGSTLCEDGHPYITDPVTGRKMCTCNLGNEMGMLLSGTISGQHVGLDTSAFYSPLIRGAPVRQDSLPPYMTSGLPGQPMTYDPSLANHPYGLLYAGLDVNGGPIRKAATRETTGPLKIWLSEHKKNPYPTKAEKIMLAIITRMTLTQVSTWFANARRRLKKENKLYPIDRENRDDDDDFDEEVFSDRERAGNTSQSEGSERKVISDSDIEDINVDLSDCSDTDDDVMSPSSINKLGAGSARLSLPDARVSLPNARLSLPDAHFVPVMPDTGHGISSSQSSDLNQHKPDHGSNLPHPPVTPGSSMTSPPTASFNRPKIWSISEIISGTSASKENQKHSPRTASTTLHPNMNLSVSNDLSLSSSSLSLNQPSPSLSVAITSSPVPSSPSSSSVSSTSSPTSPTAFRPFSSIMGVHPFLHPRPDLTGIVSRYDHSSCPNAHPLDRHPPASTNRTHTQLTPREIHSKEAPIERTHISQAREAWPPGFSSSKRHDHAPTKERPKCDALEVSPARPTPRTAASSLQPTTTTNSTSKPNWSLPSSQKTRPSFTDSNKVPITHKSTLERQVQVGLRNGEKIVPQTDGDHAH